MKKSYSERYGLLFVGVLLAFGILLLVSFTLTGNVIVESSVGEDIYSVNEDVEFTYNITVNNTELTEDLNITEVNITLPESFSFLGGSNGTDAGNNMFTNLNNVLSWNNDGLIMNLTSQNFWFNATAANPGDYNLTITVTNVTGFSSFDISVVVNDTTSPSSIDFVSPTENNNSYFSGADILVNVTTEDNGVLDTIIVNLFNSTSHQINSTNSSISPLYFNFTGLEDGVYYFNATVNDTFGNSNFTLTRTITLDTVDPAITLIDPEDDLSSENTSYDFTFSIMDSRDISSCVLIFDEEELDTLTSVDNEGETNEMSASSVSVGEYTWSINCTDEAGNIGESSVRTLTVSNASTETESTTTTAGAETTTETTTENPIITLESGSEIQFEAESNGGGVGKVYQTGLLENENNSFEVYDEIHILNVKSLSEETAEIIIFSVPQEATFLIGDEKKFEVSGDEYYDLLVKLNSIDQMGGESLKADFTIEIINELINLSDQNGVLGQIISEDNTETKMTENQKKLIIWIGILILIVAMVIAIVLNRKKSGKKRKLKKNKKIKKIAKIKK